LAFDKAGNLYVANFVSSTIEKFTPGGVGTVFASTGLNHPVGLAFDSGGNLYAVNSFDNTIYRFTPDGVGTLFASTGLNRPTYIAIIPEPGTGMLVVLGGMVLIAVEISHRKVRSTAPAWRVRSSIVAL
jgi:DNA-binding beta-propeller fold protein YncE